MEEDLNWVTRNDSQNNIAKLVCQLRSSTCGHPVFLAAFVEKIVLFPLKSFGTLVENHLTICEKVSFSALCSTSLCVHPVVTAALF